MPRSRITLSIDEPAQIMTIRYIGGLDGDEVNSSMMSQLVHVPNVWAYDSIIDMRRFDGTIMATEIEELATRWNALVQGRDVGGYTAVISDDPLVAARMSFTKTLFPTRTLNTFNTYDEGVDWIKARRENVTQAIAS